MARSKMRISHGEVVDLYVNQGETTVDISEKANVSDRYIRAILAKCGVKLTSRRRKNMYRVNDNFFKKWNADMAYVLGFVLTDGAISGNTLVITQKDSEILYKIRDVMKSNCPIRKRVNNGNSYIHALYISRKEIVDDLANLGIQPNKSLTVGLPPVPDEYMSHFVRGVIDGDGWVQNRGYMMNITSGSLLFAYQLREVLVYNGFNAYLRKQSGAYRVWVSGKDEVHRLGEWLLKDAGELYLTRKRERFEIHSRKLVA